MNALTLIFLLMVGSFILPFIASLGIWAVAEVIDVVM